MLSEYLMIGEITKPQGVRGDVKIRPCTCDVDRFLDLKTVYFEKDGVYTPVALSVRHAEEESVFAHIAGVDDRNAAETLRGTKVYIDRAHAVELDEDSCFICDLYGLKGIDTNGRVLGRITDVMQPGGNDVYVFSGTALGEVLVPALKSVVLKVDLQNGEMLLDAQRLDEVAVFDED